MRAMLLGFGLAAAVAGCQAPLAQTIAPAGPAAAGAIASDHGRVAVTIRWPYRAQVLPTSTERLRFTLSGPSAQTLELVRPVGTSPTSTASLQVDVGTGYTLSVDAYAKEFPSDFSAAFPVASGQSPPFDVAANKIASVRVVLEPFHVPTVTAFSPTNGGPGAYVTLTGSGFGATRNLPLGLKFGGREAAVVFRTDDGTASVLVPDGATSSPIVPGVDGVWGQGGDTFTVLGSLAIQPSDQTVASGSTHRFAATAVTTEGTTHLSPAVQWAMSTSSIGFVDQTGLFTATGTGTAEVQILSGRLLATASITVP